MTVNNSIKVGILLSLLQMFVITENIMKRPVYRQGLRAALFIYSSQPKIFLKKKRKTVGINGTDIFNYKFACLTAFEIIKETELRLTNA
jgi:hypothetical protein